MVIYHLSTGIIIRGVYRIFVGTLSPPLRLGHSGDEDNLFRKYRIDGKKGALVLVRPDGHMSIVDELSASGIGGVEQFLMTL